MIGRLIRIGLSIVVIFAALSLLGMQFLSQSLNSSVLLLPKLLVAAALLLVGFVLGGFVRERVDRVSYQMDFPLPLGALAQVTVVAIFVITAAAQIAVSTVVLLTIVIVMLAGLAAGFALEFGLGGQEVARALSAGRYVRHDYTIGQEITISNARGTITAIEPTSTTLDAGQGRTIRVPNHLLLEATVSGCAVPRRRESHAREYLSDRDEGTRTAARAGGSGDPRGVSDVQPTGVRRWRAAREDQAADRGRRRARDPMPVLHSGARAARSASGRQ